MMSSCFAKHVKFAKVIFIVGKRPRFSTAATGIAEDATPKDLISFNFNRAIDKAHRGKSLNAVIKLPPSALLGIPETLDSVLATKFKLKSIKDLANWKYYKISHAILVLSAKEGKESKNVSAANINLALDKAYESKSLRELLKAPPSALSGLADWVDEELELLKVKSIEDLAKSKFFTVAEALVALAAFESKDGSSK